MPEQNTDAVEKLKKLGQRVRQGWAKEHPVPEKSIETVRQAVREQWERERTTERSQDAGRGPAPPREPPEPDPER